MVAFTGRCLVHRAEIMQLRGAWQDALEEARRAGAPLRGGDEPRAAGAAFYQQGELLGLRGEFAAAEEAYREASRYGWEPQPGLALLRLAQGRADAAAAAIRRARGRDRRAAEARGAAARLRRDHAGGRRRRRGARARAASSMRSPSGYESAACSRRWPRTRAARSSWPTAMRRRRSSRCATRRSGLAASSKRRTRPRARACWSGWPAARSATRTRRRWSWTRRASAFETAAEPRPTRPRRRARREPPAPSDATGSRRASSGAASGRGGQDQQGDRGRAGPQRADGRPPRQQHLHEAGRVRRVPRRRLRLRAQARLSARWADLPRPAYASWVVGAMRRRLDRCTLWRPNDPKEGQ